MSTVRTPISLLVDSEPKTEDYRQVRHPFCVRLFTNVWWRHSTYYWHYSPSPSLYHSRTQTHLTHLEVSSHKWTRLVIYLPPRRLWVPSFPVRSVLSPTTPVLQHLLNHTGFVFTHLNTVFHFDLSLDPSKLTFQLIKPKLKHLRQPLVSSHKSVPFIIVPKNLWSQHCLPSCLFSALLEDANDFLIHVVYWLSPPPLPSFPSGVRPPP